MNIVIFGSRTLFPGVFTIDSVLNSLLVDWESYEGNKVISGMAVGVDTAALRFAGYKDLETIKMHADWDRHGKTAGFIRNQQMCDIADLAVCFWDGKSRGTQDMIKRVVAKGIPLSIQVNTIKPTQVKDYDKDIEEEIGGGDCGACSDPNCSCSCSCGKCPIKDYSLYDEPDVDELQENQDFAQDDDYQDYGDDCE